jgi:hypothetical protein
VGPFFDSNLNRDRSGGQMDIRGLTEKEKVVYSTLGDAGSVMKLYDPKKEAQRVEDGIYSFRKNGIKTNFSVSSSSKKNKSKKTN